MSEKKYCCTLFDSNYMPLGLALYQSLLLHFPPFHLWILSLDDACYHKLKLLNLPHVTVLKLADVEQPDVLAARGNRTWQEYCWTLASVLTWHIFDNNAIDHISYLHADICFFTDPGPIFDEIGDASIMIIPHRFPERLKHSEVNGLYNVQMVYFKKDQEGSACLKQWRDNCVDWCYYEVEDDRMGDQKYLDQWPIQYKNVRILKHIGAGAALWNIEQYRVSESSETIRINDMPLVFYHFHGFKYYEGGYFYTGLESYGLTHEYFIIYKKYVQLINSIVEKYNISARGLSFRQLADAAPQHIQNLSPFNTIKISIAERICRGYKKYMRLVASVKAGAA